MSAQHSGLGRRVRRWLWRGAVWLAACGAPLSAGHAQLFAADGLDPHFCDQPALRQTVIYIDDMVMVEGQTEWALRLSAKLRNTLAPGERVTLVRLSPSAGISHELWSGCWPAYTAEAAAKFRAETYLLSRNPLDRVADQQRYFMQGLGGGLTQIYNEAKRPAATVRFTAAAAPTKQILRALASDDGRFSQSRTTLRAILYSDMAENSDLGSALKPVAATPPPIGPKLGVYLRRSVFYGYGLGTSVSDVPVFSENARTFWNAAIRSMASTMVTFGADLNVPDTIPVHAFAASASLDLDGQVLEGRLSLMTDRQGVLVDSWIGISRLTSAALTGNYLCRAGEETTPCQLNAVTIGGVTTKSPSETLTLAGSEKSGLKGRLGVPGTKALFAITTAPSGG